MKVIKNYLYNMSYQMLNLVIPLITIPYISRVLGLENIGTYSFTSSIVQYFILFGMLGIGMYGGRKIAQNNNGDTHKRSQVFWSVYELQLITMTISLISYLIIFVVLNQENQFIYLVQVITLLGATIDITWFYTGIEDFKKTVTRNTIVKLISVAMIFIFVKTSEDLVLYITILASSSLVGQLTMWMYMPKLVHKPKLVLKEILAHLQPTIVLFIPQIATSIYLLLDRTMLGTLASVHDVGLYDQGMKIVKMVLVIVTSLGVVMLPRMSNLFANGKHEEAKKMIYQSFRFYNLVAFPIMFGLIAIAPFFIDWFFGPGYDGVQNVIIISSLMMVALSWSNIGGIQLLLPLERNREFTISVTTGAVVNFGLNLILIPKLGYIGAAIATLVTECSVTAVQFFMLRDYLEFKMIFKPLLKIVPASLTMFIVSFGIGYFANQSTILVTMSQVVIGITVYIIMLFILKVITVAELKSVKKRGN
ncbi:MAG: flippase [Culicoidibacterales bacterium]